MRVASRRRVHDAEQSVRVRVVDEARGQDRVQDRLHGRRRRCRVDGRGTELAGHLGVRQRVELREPKEHAQANRRKTRSLDRREIPTRSFDVEQLAARRRKDPPPRA